MMQQRWSRDRLLAALLTGWLTLCLSTPALAGVSARLDRDKVYAGDPVTLVIESDGRQSGQPDLAPLNKDFKVLGNSTSTQVSIINGRRSDKTSWTVQLEPRRLGKLRIPPVRVGTEKTRALELDVTDIPEQVASRQSEHVFLEVEADTHGDHLYVQQQIPYTVRLYYDDRVLNGDLGAPQPEHAVVEPLGEDKNYAVTRKGRRYNVIERHYAISPEKSGKLRIPPATFRGQMASAQNRSGSGSHQDRLIERFFRNTPFANDPFFSTTPFADPGEPVRIRSRAISVDVRPRPATAGSNWLPAEQITLHDSWTDNPPQLRAGEPVSRTITLHAKGLTGAQLPAVQLEPPAQTRLYPESPVNESRTDGDTVYGISKQNFTYIPGTAGKLMIPPVELRWWNTHTNQEATARVPEWELNVEPGVGGTPTRQVDTPEKRLQTAGEEPPQPETGVPAASWLDPIKAFKLWPVVAGALLLSAVTMFAAFRLRHTKPAAPAVKQDRLSETHPGKTIKTLLPELERACDSNDARAAAHALLALGRARWPDDPPRNLGVLAARLGHGYEQIVALDRALYAADATKWNGSELWNAVSEAWHTKTATEKPSEDGLKPLYPQGI